MDELIAVASVKGAGGVTTTALALSAALAARGTSVTLIEADPSGASLLGWCPDLETGGTGLYEAVLHRRFVATQQLGDVQVIVSQGDPWRISSALERPRVWRDLLRPLPGTVVVDVGRLYPGTPALPIVGTADTILMCAPPEPGPLAAVLDWINRAGQVAATDRPVDATRVRIVTVDTAENHHQRIDPGRLAHGEIGDAYFAHLPFDARAVDLLCRGASLAHRSMRRSRLALAAAAVGSRLVGVSA